MCPTATCLILPINYISLCAWRLAMQQKNHTEHGVNQFSTQNLPGLNFSHTRKFEHSVLLRVARLPHQNWSQERLPVLCCLSQPQYFPKRAASPITIGVSMQWQWVTRVQTINPFTYVSIIFCPNQIPCKHL